MTLAESLPAKADHGEEFQEHGDSGHDQNQTGQLYNMVSDPGETCDIAREQTGVCNQLKGQSFRWIETA
jgi:hypothetical protein